MGSFRVLQIEGSDVKNMKFFDITPDKSINVVSGKNGSGKSSLLSAIDLALKGKSSLKFSPVRNGTEQAKVKMKIGAEKIEYIIERKLGADGSSTLKLMTGDNMRPSSQQKVIDGLIGNISFDPVAFVLQQDGKGRVELLRKITGLDFSKEDAEFSELYEKRTLENRRLRDVEGEIKQYADIKEGVKLRAIEVVQKEYQGMVDHNNFIRDAKLDIVSADSVIKAAEKSIKEYEELIKKQRGIIENAKKLRIEASDKLKGKKEKDLSKIEEELKTVRKNADIQYKVKRKKELQKNLNGIKSELDDINSKMECIKKSKEDKIKSTKMPIAGLEVGDSDILYNKKEFNSLSQSEKMRVAIAIEMADNPKLAVIKVENGNALDEDNFDELCAICKKNEYQLWIEVPSKKKESNCIFIEDGVVVK